MLNDPKLYLELVAHSLKNAAHCGSPLAVLGLRRLTQSYLELADEALHQNTRISSDAAPASQPAYSSADT